MTAIKKAVTALSGTDILNASELEKWLVSVINKEIEKKELAADLAAKIRIGSKITGLKLTLEQIRVHVKKTKIKK